MKKRSNSIGSSQPLTDFARKFQVDVEEAEKIWEDDPASSSDNSPQYRYSKIVNQHREFLRRIAQRNTEIMEGTNDEKPASIFTTASRMSASSASLVNSE